jgi:radical SAM protein with 4Fe4S-binding SPASM domain
MCRPIGLIDTRFFERVVRQAASLGCKEIRLFNFGEPLLHPDIVNLVSLTVNAGLAAVLQTNGLLLDEPMTRQLLHAGLRYIGVSTNGLTDAEYAMVRPGFALADLRDRIKRTRAAAQSEGIPLHIHLTAQILAESTTERRADIHQFVNSWKGLPDSISVSGLSRYESIAYPKDGRLIKRADDPAPRRPDSEVNCTEPFDRMIIKWDGRVTPCCVDFDATYVLGDATKTPLDVIWQAAPARQLRAIVQSHAYDQSPLCRECPKRISREFTLVFQKPRP